MSLLWKEAFTLGDFSWSNTNSFSDIIEITDLEALKHFLDAVHVKFCLLKPWCETENYPLVDSRDLLPSFEAELWEYKGLPGFPWWRSPGLWKVSAKFSNMTSSIRSSAR